MAKDGNNNTLSKVRKEEYLRKSQIDIAWVYLHVFDGFDNDLQLALELLPSHCQSRPYI